MSNRVCPLLGQLGRAARYPSQAITWMNTCELFENLSGILYGLASLKSRVLGSTGMFTFASLAAWPER